MFCDNKSCILFLSILPFGIRKRKVIDGVFLCSFWIDLLPFRRRPFVTYSSRSCLIDTFPLLPSTRCNAFVGLSSLFLCLTDGAHLKKSCFDSSILLYYYYPAFCFVLFRSLYPKSFSSCISCIVWAGKEAEGPWVV